MKKIDIKNNRTVRNLTLSAMFLALGLVLPFVTGQIPQVGNMLLPMHIPVFLCGLICGWQYGLPVGLIVPILRSLLVGKPPMFPNATAMMFELAVYGLVCGLVYSLLRKRGVLSVYIALISSMLAGRLVWGVVMAVISGASGSAFTFRMFIGSAFLNAVPGIIIQIILIPAIMLALDKAGLVRFGKDLFLNAPERVFTQIIS